MTHHISHRNRSGGREREHSKEISSINKEDKAWLAYTSCPLTYASVSADRRQQIVSNLRPLWSAAGCGKRSPPLHAISTVTCRVLDQVLGAKLVGKRKALSRVFEVPGFKLSSIVRGHSKRSKPIRQKRSCFDIITQPNHLDLVCWTACRLFRIEKFRLDEGEGQINMPW